MRPQVSRPILLCQSPVQLSEPPLPSGASESQILSAANKHSTAPEINIHPCFGPRAVWAAK